MADTGTLRGTGKRGHGVGSVVFIDKATAIMISSVLFKQFLYCKLMEINYAPRIGEVSSISKESVLFFYTGHFASACHPHPRHLHASPPR